MQPLSAQARNPRLRLLTLAVVTTLASVPVLITVSVASAPLRLGHSPNGLSAAHSSTSMKSARLTGSLMNAERVRTTTLGEGGAGMRRIERIRCRGWLDNLFSLGQKKILVFRSSGAMIPKQQSQMKGGEDAFFMSRLGGDEGVGDTSLLMKHSADGYNKASREGVIIANLEAATVIGVADGVGSWSQYRIDPGQYSKQLMMNTARAALEISKKRASQGSAAELLEKGHAMTKLKGSTTTTIACLSGNTLSAATIGDTAFVLLRNGKIFYRSPTQEYEFDTPYQLADTEISDGYGVFSEPEDALLYSVRDIRPGDVLVMASDGLFDNLQEYEIEQIVSEKMAQGAGAESIARELMERARAHSLDPNYVSPWAQEKGQSESGFIGGTLRKIGIKAVFGDGYRGGKPDDISVVAGIAQYLIPGTDLFLPI